MRICSPGTGTVGQQVQHACLVQVLAILPANAAWERTHEGPSAQVLVTHMEDLDGAVGCRLQTGLTMDVVDIWEVKQKIEKSLCVSCLSAFHIDLGKYF